MKKSLTIVLAAALAFVACKPTVVDSLKVNSITPSETVIVKEGTEEPIIVVFSSTKAWTASVNDAEIATVTPKSGEAGDECRVKLNVAENETMVDRDIVLTLAAEGVEPVKVTFKQQSQFHMVAQPEVYEVAVDGGQVTFTLDVNVAYEYKAYEDTFTWMHVTKNENTFTVNLDANGTYDARESYIKFTTTEIPDLDPETGEPTGDPYAVRVYFEQAGNATVVWQTALTDDFIVPEGSYATLSSAIMGGKLYVTNGQKVFPVNTATGALEAALNIPVCPRGLANDSVGNVLAFVGGDYGEGGEPLTFGVIDASFNMTPIATNLPDNFYGYGLDGLTVTGDLKGKAAVTAFSAAGYEAGSYLVFYQIDGGKYVTDGGQTDYVGLPWTAAIWGSRNSIGKCATNDVTGGVFFIGYDGNYNLHYNPGTSGANWMETYATGSSWAEGYNAMDTIEWNGHKYCAFIGMAYFPYWGMPSYLHIVNVDDPTAPVALTVQEVYATREDQILAFTSLNLAVEDGALCAYLTDGQLGNITKIKFPVL